MLTMITTTFPMKDGVIKSDRTVPIDFGVEWLSIPRSLDVIDLVIASCFFVSSMNVSETYVLRSYGYHDSLLIDK